MKGLPVLPALVALLVGACGGAGDGRGSGPPSAPEGPEDLPPVEVRSSLDRAVVTIGDLLTHRVTVEHPPGVEVEIPRAGRELGGLEVVEQGRTGGRGETASPRGAPEAKRVVERWVRLRAGRVGSYVLPPVTVTWRRAGPPEPGGEDGGRSEGPRREGLAESGPLFLEVRSVLAAGGGEDIRGLKPLQRPGGFPWTWVLGLAVGIALIGGGWWAWKHRSRGDAESEEPEPDLQRRTLAELERLEATHRGDEPGEEALRRLHFRLSTLLRGYLEERFGLPATDLTTEEILAALPRLGTLDAAPERELREFLLATERVKFARHRPSEDEVGATLTRARHIVEATRPAAESPGVERPQHRTGEGV